MQRRFVYVLYGFGSVNVFATLKLAKAAQHEYAHACEIVRAPIKRDTNRLYAGERYYGPINARGLEG